MTDKLIRIAPGVYRCGKFDIIKIARYHWQTVTPKGYGNDFIKLSDAVYWCRNGGSFYPRNWETYPRKNVK